MSEYQAQPAGIRARMGLAEWIILTVLAAIWGGSFFFIGVAVKELPPLTIVTLRVGLAAIVLWAVVLAREIPRPTAPRAWLAMATMGVLNNVLPFTLLVWGQTQIASGLASILNATTPIFAVALAGFLLPDERVTPLKVGGVIIGVVGAVVVIGPAELLTFGTDLLAQLACVVAGLFYALGGVYGRRFKDLGVHPLVTAAGMVTTSTLVLAPITIVVDQPWKLPLPGAATWAGILGLAVLSTAVAYILYFRLLASSGATNLMLVTLLIPVSAILLGTLFLGERLLPGHFVGMGIIGLGLIVIDGRLLGRRITGDHP